MSRDGYRDWRVVQSIEIGATAEEVWDVIGGFFTIHEWHPDIERVDVPDNQTSMRQMRRILTFPGQPHSQEELVSLDNANCHYQYKWHSGDWGERIQKYYSDLRAFDVGENRSVVQWVARFYYNADGISEFYRNGLLALQQRFPLKN